MSTEVQIFTIGHSSHLLGNFLWLLRKHQIEALVDVRRYPGSRRYPHFSRESLSASIGAEGDYQHCHRRLLSDHLVANGVTVQHIFPSGEVKPHKLTPRAKIVVGTVTYPGQPTLFDM